MAEPTIRDRIVELRRVRAGDLAPDPKNWRRHPETQRRALQSVLGSIGYAAAAIARETDEGLVLIDGHLRSELDPDALLPVLVLDVDEAEAATLLATLDPLSAMAQTDQNALQALLEEAAVDDEDLVAFLGELAGEKSKAGLTDPDDVPDVPEKPTTKAGDLWLLGEHRLLCGDATKAGDVARVLDGGNPSLIATDPPYGVDYAGVVASRTNQKKGGWEDIRNDEISEHAAVLTGRAIAVAKDHAAPGCAVLVWHPVGENYGPFRHELEAAGLHVHKQIIWVKPSLVFGRHEYHWRHESAMYGWFETSRANFFGSRDETTVWEVQPSPAFTSGGPGEHPTQKPVELTARPIRNHTKPGDLIYEPFAGSGSALIAAEETGRRCAAVDIEPRYCDVAVKRWEAFTGETAVLENSEDEAMAAFVEAH